MDQVPNRAKNFRRFFLLRQDTMGHFPQAFLFFSYFLQQLYFKV